MEERSTLNLNDSNVIEKECTVSDIRENTEEMLENFSNWLDEAQVKVYTGKAEEVYLVIKVTRG